MDFSVDSFVGLKGGRDGGVKCREPIQEATPILFPGPFRGFPEIDVGSDAVDTLVEDLGHVRLDPDRLWIPTHDVTEGGDSGCGVIQELDHAREGSNGVTNPAKDAHELVPDLAEGGAVVQSRILRTLDDDESVDCRRKTPGTRPTDDGAQDSKGPPEVDAEPLRNDTVNRSQISQPLRLHVWKHGKR